MSARLPSGVLEGRVRVPGGKSMTNRALVCAALAPGESELVNPLDCEDTRTLSAILCRLGARMEERGETWRVTGPLSGGGDDLLTLDVGAAGTPARFLTAILCALPGRFVLDGSPRMRERPMGPLVEALRSLGARIEPLGRDGFLPLRIEGGGLGGLGGLQGGRVQIRGDVSSQFLSALLLAGPLVPGGIELDIVGPLASEAYLALTRHTLARFTESGRLHPVSFAIPGDDSAACFYIAGALVSGGCVELEGLVPASGHPDAIFREWAERAGGELTWREENGENGQSVLSVLTVRGDASRSGALPLDADVDPAPDGALPLAALLAFSRGTSRLSGVARLRDKESDRLRAALDLLERAGASAREEPDAEGRPSVVINGPAGRPRPADFCAHGDHRVAMAAAVLALALPPGSSLDEPAVVAKSYPRFFEEWARLVTER